MWGLAVSQLLKPKLLAEIRYEVNTRREVGGMCAVAGGLGASSTEDVVFKLGYLK